MKDDGFLERYAVPPPPAPPDPPWCWRNLRNAEVSVRLHLMPPSWRWRVWWSPETFHADGGIHLWFVSFHLWCDIGNVSDETWRGRFGLCEIDAWRRAGGE